MKSFCSSQFGVAPHTRTSLTRPRRRRPSATSSQLCHMRILLAILNELITNRRRRAGSVYVLPALIGAALAAADPLGGAPRGLCMWRRRPRFSWRAKKLIKESRRVPGSELSLLEPCHCFITPRPRPDSRGPGNLSLFDCTKSRCS